MRIPRAPHSWSVTTKRAIELQRELAKRVVRTGGPKRIRLVAGLDIAFSKDGEQAIAGAVIWDFHEREVVEECVATRAVAFPYVPGLLSFREAPALIACLRKVRSKVDLLMLDGQGIAHPRRMGLAAHVGLIADISSMGCAKSLLVGEYEMPDECRGAVSPLTHAGETIGSVLRTRDRVKPVFISVGHKLSLERAIKAALICGEGYRLPEPTRLADRLVAKVKRSS